MPLTTITPLLSGLGLGLELFATLLTLCLRAGFDYSSPMCRSIRQRSLPSMPTAWLTASALFALGLVTLAWPCRLEAAAHAGQAGEAMLALLLAYASTRLLLGLCLGLPTESAPAAWSVAAALPLGLGLAYLLDRFRPRPESLPPAPGS